jgi:hypothetical protein
MTMPDSRVPVSGDGRDLIAWAHARKALDAVLWVSAVAGGVYVLGTAIERAMTEKAADDAAQATPPVPNAMEFDSRDLAEQEAAELLGVPLDASADQIRGALRAKLARSGLHPDQGGDGHAAKRLIAAKNLLMERQRAEDRS